MCPSILHTFQSVYITYPKGSGQPPWAAGEYLILLKSLVERGETTLERLHQAAKYVSRTVSGCT